MGKKAELLKTIEEIKHELKVINKHVDLLEEMQLVPSIDSPMCDGDYSGSLKQKVKILEERVDELEQSDFANIVDKLTKTEDNVVVKVKQDGQPIVDFVKGKGSKVPYTFIRRAKGHICGNCAWASGNVCILGLTPKTTVPFDRSSCPAFDARQYYA